MEPSLENWIKWPLIRRQQDPIVVLTLNYPKQRWASRVYARDITIVDSQRQVPSSFWPLTSFPIACVQSNTRTPHGSTLRFSRCSWVKFQPKSIPFSDTHSRLSRRSSRGVDENMEHQEAIPWSVMQLCQGWWIKLWNISPQLIDDKIDGIKNVCKPMAMAGHMNWKFVQAAQDQVPEEVVLRIQGIVCSWELPPIRRPYEMCVFLFISCFLLS